MSRCYCGRPAEWRQGLSSMIYHCTGNTNTAAPKPEVSVIISQIVGPVGRDSTHSSHYTVERLDS